MNVFPGAEVYCQLWPAVFCRRFLALLESNMLAGSILPISKDVYSYSVMRRSKIPSASTKTYHG